MNLLVPIGSSLAAGCAGLIAYGAVYPRAQLFGETLCRTNSSRKLAITFDDGPNPAITPKLLDLLAKRKARATFFMVGKYVRECPEIVREAAARGHVIANHTQTHPNLFWLRSESIRAELQQCKEAIGEALQVDTKWFRPPFGFRNPWVVKTAADLGMKTVMWTLIPGDWTPQPAEKLIANMQPIADHANRLVSSSGASGDVLCLHDGGHRALNADRTHTLKALEHWLPRWRDAGLEFVTIEEAVSTPAT
ncbi:MAG TPA: polysaccharide deacetylase family protein [Candidatus Dormibacteraeota bacterium]|nr:polysaccharide deacetylase family protein [Candidatus Dormibacteraeota bacterium]